jgi:hypothetical protein
LPGLSEGDERRVAPARQPGEEMLEHDRLPFASNKRNQPERKG